MSKYQLKGNRILIERPVRPESAITLTPEVERQLDEEMIKRWTSLTVVAVGDKIETGIKAGDKVYIAPDSIGSAGHIEIEGVAYMILREYDVVMIWD